MSVGWVLYWWFCPSISRHDVWMYFNRICKMRGPLGEESPVKWPGEESMRRLQVQTPQYVTVAGQIHAQQPACAHWASQPITPSCIPPFSPSRNGFVPALNVVSQRYRFCLCSLSLPHWLIHKCTCLYTCIHDIYVISCWGNLCCNCQFEFNVHCGVYVQTSSNWFTSCSLEKQTSTDHFHVERIHAVMVSCSSSWHRSSFPKESLIHHIQISFWRVQNFLQIQGVY